MKGPSAETGFVAVADEAHLRRERIRARELRASPWWKRRRATGLCHYCGGRFEPASLTMDHLVPLVRGGRSTRGNVVPACKECNNRKKHSLPWEDEVSPSRAGSPPPALRATSQGEVERDLPKGGSA